MGPDLLQRLERLGKFLLRSGRRRFARRLKPHKHEYRLNGSLSRIPLFAKLTESPYADFLQWDDLAVSWTVKVDDINDLYISKLKENLSNVQGFGWQGWVAASQFSVLCRTPIWSRL